MVALLSLMAFLGSIGPITTHATPEVPPREKTLYILEEGKVADPTNLNLYAIWAFGWGLHQVCLENMFYVNLQTGEYIPWTAKGYEYNPEYTEITIYLRKGVKWSDGRPFTADDVVFTYNELLIKYAPELAWSSMVKEWVKSAVKIDDYTVKLVLTKPNPHFHMKREAFPVARVWSGIHIMPKHIWEGKDPLKFKFYPPVGTGPYKFVSSSETTYVWERRDDWWATEVFGIRPAPQFIVFTYVGPEETVAMKMVANEGDAVQIHIMGLGTFLKVAERNPYVRVWYAYKPYAWLDPCPRGLFLQCARYPWTISEVRRAVSYYIDRDKVIDLAFEGTTTPSWGPFPYYALFQPGGIYYDAIKDLIEKYEPTKYDPAKADEILTKLGFFKVGGKWCTPEGKPVTMNLLTDGYDPEKMKVHAVLYDLLTEAGFEVTRTILVGPPHADALLKGDWDVTSHCLCPGDTDPYDNLELTHSKYWRELGKPAPWYEANSWRYKNPAYDAILDEMAVIPPGTPKFIDLFKSVMEIFFKDVPIVPFYQAPALVPFNTYYWTGWPSAENPWNMPVWWWATFNLVVNGYLSPATGEWVGGLRPKTIDYELVYFTKDTPKFRGIDLSWYGPLKAGDARRIPADDAEFWIRKGYASYTVVPPELVELEKTVDKLKETVGSLEKAVAALEKAVPAGFKEVTEAMAGITKAMGEVTKAMGEVTRVMGEVTGAVSRVEKTVATKEDVGASIGALSTLVYGAIAVEVVVLAIVLVALVFIMRRKPA